MPYIELQGVHKSYRKRDLSVDVLTDLSMTVDEGEFVALMGPSGSGKSTLLNLLGGLDAADRGRLRVGGVDLVGMPEAAMTHWRSRQVGFIFQMYHLLPVLTAAENVELPLLLFRMTAADRRERVRVALSVVGLESRADHKPGQLSGGQEQRVAIARALVTDPALILADEPTGNLDADSAKEILDLLETLSGSHNKTLVMVTHDRKAASHASRVIHLEKGQLFADVAQQAEAVNY